MQANKLFFSVQYVDSRLKDALPRPKLRRWAKAALFAPAYITLRFVNEEEGRELNCTWRGKDYATNVLTFAYTEGQRDEAQIIQSDIVLCTDVLEREAVEQEKTLEAHTAHLLIHGILHAQGYNHESDDEAFEMEALEVKILATLGFSNPYQNQC